MATLIEPFTGFVPASAFGHRIVRPSRSMLSAEQIEAARSDPLNFRRALGRGADASHDRAQKWLQKCRSKQALQPVGPAIIVHRMTRADLVGTGLLADVSLSAYESGLVKRHEFTLAKTEAKMAHYMRSTRVFGNPVALAHRPHAGISAAITAETQRAPDIAFITADGFSHELWTIEGEAAYELCAGFDQPLYIVDGHHRLAAASLVAAEENRTDARLPVGLFAADQFRVRSFARCIVDPALVGAEVIEALGAKHRLEAIDEEEPRPRRRFEFGLKIGEQSFLLHLDAAVLPADAYGSLDVNLLQDLILAPVFGITYPRQDPRLRFVADASEGSLRALECAAWFLPFPVAVNDVMGAADMGQTMPPKSTWFAPKLPSGLIIRPVDPDG